jgi:hypothetical protein
MNQAGVSVITTIQPPTDCVLRLLDRLRPAGATLLVIGDQKGPAEFNEPGTEFWPLARQLEQFKGKSAEHLPLNHYARKNLGYLLAIRRGAAWLFETDDDNMPTDAWQVRSMANTARLASSGGWCNVYKLFGDGLIWPRGLPLAAVGDNQRYLTNGEVEEDCPVQQGLVDGSPDVDAVWRLTSDRPVTFNRAADVRLLSHTWCPFNSQATWWWPPAYPLLYLPGTCSSRLTDIWRSFVAQRCLWAAGFCLSFHAPAMFQARNPHDLVKDLRDELQAYLLNPDLVECLGGLTLSGGRGWGPMCDNLAKCYRALIHGGFVLPGELPKAEAWCEDVMSADSGGVNQK